MIFALPFPIFIFEIIVFFLLLSRVGFLNTVSFYFLPCLFGLLILSFQSRTALFKLQRTLSQGENPGPKLLSAVATFFAGVFFLVPMVTTRLVAIFLITPGVKKLFFLVIQKWIAQKVRSKGFGRFGNAGFGPSGFRAEFRANTNPHSQQWSSEFEESNPLEKDAKVIDVEPLEIEHSESKKHHDS